ncbi:MAG: hypothetical protein WBS24_18320 [Terriglobales bacterium]
MNSQHRYAIAAWSVVYLLAAAALFAQEPVKARPAGIPQDWSEHTIAFTFDGLRQHPEVLYEEPRVMHQVMRRLQGHNSHVADEIQTGSKTGSKPNGPREPQLDWSFNFQKGHVAAEMYPAKYSFNPATASCANDYAVFALSTAGATGGQANLVGFNDLYAGSGGICGSAPNVLFAYNVSTQTGGKVATSPILSLDGTKIGFVESLGTSSIFHVLTWTAHQGSITDAAAPAAITSLTYSSTAGTTSSSPWIDYNTDTVYVSDDSGILYKITNVFAGTPTLEGSPWPVTVSSGTQLTPPVLDKHLGVIMIGARNGDLYQVDATSGSVSAMIVGAHGDKNAGLMAPPIVDITNSTTFAVSANDGTSAVVVQADTTLLTQITKGRIGLGAATGNSVNVFQPALSNNYYTSPSSGALYVCGTGASDSTPWQYSFGFSGRNMNATPAASSQLLTSTAATCTGWTEFFNPNVGGGTDFFFFGLTQDCTGTGTSGCVAEITTTNSTPVTTAVDGGPSGIVVDNYNTSPQASSLYLSAQKVNEAYKFTQNGLN